jgi:hypothetical protein
MRRQGLEIRDPIGHGLAPQEWQQALTVGVGEWLCSGQLEQGRCEVDERHR